MTEEEAAAFWSRYLEWRLSHMHPVRQWIFTWRLLLSLIRGRSNEFLQNDARGLDKAITTSYNELQRRAAQ